MKHQIILLLSLLMLVNIQAFIPSEKRVKNRLEVEKNVIFAKIFNNEKLTEKEKHECFTFVNESIAKKRKERHKQQLEQRKLQELKLKTDKIKTEIYQKYLVNHVKGSSVLKDFYPVRI